MKKYLLPGALGILLLLAAAFLWRNNDETAGPVREAVAQAFSEKYSRPVGTFAIEVQKETNAFARGTVRFEGEMGGGMWFAARTARGWELAFDGNGMMNCEIANAYDFPSDIVPGCIDTQNEDTFVRR
ncbi:MAG TPA: hypothetical protein DEB30_05410 [Candidatus Peribacter riflensis]|uniref:Uncharacterized protein n=1 Tax=Candidatus Peribacter riflensis TaxID=1735162 RepID=A0A0S1SSY2_9BACT|nr:MAG: hypothetical protein PeribacterA2_0113 [Candidatus Peribacter riflensis]OGJ76691.1 MAG: hypothetical protein A2398_03610 [Candidatus Peribacteria bacterium RIFOXYB1_FULL_57_12]OGJ78774.1 MAG: hypothetical protein A2412_02330 [Candidatus Peribacteria bacterium RIFOXYC1_FULL_58_8]ALM10611.1 MAG: hypothetical protein PeribacterB2_0113 [Candidatus Peribacter riflensis]ALM11713.1 MAG: hypothetical protein PeribacterC2_0112 [Candidatus Peribacter riflensis]